MSGGTSTLSADRAILAVRAPFPPDLVLTPLSRWPTTLPAATVKTVLAGPQAAALRIAQPARGRITRKRVTLAVVVRDNLVYTRMCLESVLANTDYPNYEVVVVDNGSMDDTPAYLESLSRCYRHVRVVRNECNRGFAPANNQAFAEATGEVLVLLNNDTLVPCGWLGRLVRWLEDPAIGIVGPVSNRTGNEAQIGVPYRTYGEFERFAAEYGQAHEGKSFDIRMAAMFCTALRRDLYERIGPLDERFEVGLFEDDDYAMRVRQAGNRVVCAEDVFVHHFGQATIGHLARTGEYGTLFHANRARWEEKWGVRWEPYRRRVSASYQGLVERLRDIIETAVPPQATVLVVSKGDEELVQFGSCHGWHFPRDEDGLYCGFHPKDCAAAVSHLEDLRKHGGEYLLLPRTAFWWLEHYPGFREHLNERYRLVVDEPESCKLFALR
jgi:GT2 family glycosyltransferase